MCHKKMLVPSGNTDLDVYLQMANNRRSDLNLISTSALQFHSHPIPIRIGTMKINPIQLGLDISDYKRGGRGARAARPGHRKISAAAMPIDLACAVSKCPCEFREIANGPSFLTPLI